MDGATAVDVEGWRVETVRIRPADRYRTGILHVDLTVLADRVDANDGSVSPVFDVQLLAVEIDVECPSGIDV